VLSIVVPAYNESGYLASTLDDLHRGMADRHLEYEIVVVENGSLDDTRAVAARLAQCSRVVRTLSLTRPDYGAALRAGILEARGEIVVCFDTDHYDLEFLGAALRALEGRNRADLVVGSKRAAASIDARPWPRRLVTATFAVVLRLGFGLGLSDTHGMKAMRRAAVIDLVLECEFDGDLFDTELVIRASRARKRVIELPVVVTERRPPRTSVWSRVPRTLVGLVRLRLALGRS